MKTFKSEEDKEGKVVFLLCRIANGAKKTEMVVRT